MRTTGEIGIVNSSTPLVSWIHDHFIYQSAQNQPLGAALCRIFRAAMVLYKDQGKKTKGESNHMWCQCSGERGDSGPEKVLSAEQQEVTGTEDIAISGDRLCVGGSFKKSGWMRIAALGIGGMLAPHAVCVVGGHGLAGCVVGGLGLAGLGGWKIVGWCNHSSENFGVTLAKVPMPENWQELSAGDTAGAWERLLINQPGLQKVLERKVDEADGEPIQVRFILDNENGDVSVLICSKEAMCPCKGDKRAQYDVSHLEDVVKMVNGPAMP